MKAFAYCDGEIRFAFHTPEEAIEIADGPLSDLRPVIEGSARLAFDSETLLVPGVPEADDERAAVGELIAYSQRVRAALERRSV